MGEGWVMYDNSFRRSSYNEIARLGRGGDLTSQRAFYRESKGRQSLLLLLQRHACIHKSVFGPSTSQPTRASFWTSPPPRD